MSHAGDRIHCDAWSRDWLLFTLADQLSDIHTRPGIP